MLESQSIQMKLSELRQKINAYGADDDTEYRAEEMDALTNEYNTLESRYRMALIRESELIEETPTPELDGEKRESRQLELDIETRAYISALLNDGGLEGREKEYNDSLGIVGGGGGVINMPWAALLSPEARAEHRAVSVAPSDSAMQVRSILGRIFARSSAAYLGVSMPIVGVGDVNYPIISASSGVSPANVAAGAAVDETAAVIKATVLEPRRLGATYRLRVEDANRLAQMEDSLRLDLAASIEESRDAAIFKGDGASPNVSGLLDVIGDEAKLTAPDDPTAVADFAAYASAKAMLVDGRYAVSAEDVALVVGVDTYGHAATLFQAGSGIAALDRLGGRVSAHIPAKDGTSNVQLAVASRAMGRAVAPTWPAVALVIDRITAAKNGEILITATSLWNFSIIDSEAYKLLKFKLA